MIREKSPSTNVVDARLSALADDAMTRRLIAAHPMLFSADASATAARACKVERAKTPREPALFAVISIVLVLWLASLTALVYGLAIRQLAHTASAAVGMPHARQALSLFVKGRNLG